MLFHTYILQIGLCKPWLLTAVSVCVCDSGRQLGLLLFVISSKLLVRDSHAVLELGCGCGEGADTCDWLHVMISMPALSCSITETVHMQCVLINTSWVLGLAYNQTAFTNQSDLIWDFWCSPVYFSSSFFSSFASNFCFACRSKLAPDSFPVTVKY